jgi:hypothetical protein
MGSGRVLCVIFAGVEGSLRNRVHIVSTALGRSECFGRLTRAAKIGRSAQLVREVADVAEVSESWNCHLPHLIYATLGSDNGAEVRWVVQKLGHPELSLIQTSRRISSPIWACAYLRGRAL